MYSDTSPITRGGKTSTRPRLRESYRAHGKVLHRTIANVSQCSEAELEALRLALRHKQALAHLGTIQAAITLPQGMSWGAVWTVSHIARRLGIDKALGTTRAGKLARWHVLARGMDQGSRLSAVRRAMTHAACDVLGVGPLDADALYAHLDWLAGVQAAVEDRLYAQRTQSPPVPLFWYDGTRSDGAGAPNALAALGDNRAGTQGKRPMVSGLLGDEDGQPVSIAVVPGHPSAPHTFAAPLAQVKGRCGVTALPFGGDRGRLQGQQVAARAAPGFHDMTAITQPPMAQLRRTGTCHMDLFAQE